MEVRSHKSLKLLGIKGQSELANSTGSQFYCLFNKTLEYMHRLNIYLHLEKKLPKSFITKNGMGVTAKAVDYLNPLIQGESNPPFKNGIPNLKEFKLVPVQKKLTTWQ